MHGIPMYDYYRDYNSTQVALIGMNIINLLKTV